MSSFAVAVMPVNEQLIGVALAEVLLVVTGVALRGVVLSRPLQAPLMTATLTPSDVPQPNASDPVASFLSLKRLLCPSGEARSTVMIVFHAVGAVIVREPSAV